MANDLWQLGIVHPVIYNHSFRMRNIFETTLNGAVASGNSAFTIDQPSDAPSAQYIMGGKGGVGNEFVISDLNKIILGPSTDVDNEGAVEEIKIASASGNIITTAENSVYDYADEDPITIYGTACPDGWVFSSDAEPSGIIDSDYFGHDDICSFQTTIKGAGCASTMKAELILGKLIPNVAYGLTCKYKRNTAPAANTMGLQLHENGSASASTTITLSSGSPTSWADGSGTFTSAQDQTDDAFLRLQWPSSGGVYQYAIDCLNLQFATYNKDGANPYYLFNEIPSDIKVYHAGNKLKTNKLLSGFSIYTPQPNKVLYDRKYGISCMFKYTQSSTNNLFQDIMAYLAWQDRGYLLALKTGISELPPYLIGRLQITNVNNHIHDTGVKSFGIKFEETV